MRSDFSVKKAFDRNVSVKYLSYPMSCQANASAFWAHKIYTSSCNLFPYLW